MKNTILFYFIMSLMVIGIILLFLGMNGILRVFSEKWNSISVIVGFILMGLTILLMRKFR